MKIINYLNIVLIGVILTSCSKVTDPVKEIGLGSRDINYQADEKVDSLIIPPNLTEPSNLQALTEVEEILDDNQVIQRVQNIEIKRAVGINEDKTSEIKKSNLEIKNFFSKLGIFLIG